jgi:hypothetical protein
MNIGEKLDFVALGACPGRRKGDAKEGQSENVADHGKLHSSDGTGLERVKFRLLGEIGELRR